MTRRRRTPLRVAVESLVAGLISFALVALVFVVLRPDDDTEEADVAEGAVGVDEVVALGSRRQDVVVTGYVFVGEERAVLCAARDDDDPPFCSGTTISVEQLDTSRLDLVVPDDAPAYSRHEVTLAGTYRLATLTVREILGS